MTDAQSRYLGEREERGRETPLDVIKRLREQLGPVHARPKREGTQIPDSEASRRLAREMTAEWAKKRDEFEALHPEEDAQ